jgi:acyl dehydratase
MSASLLHIRHQLPVIAALVKTAAGSGAKSAKGAQTAIEAVLPPRPPELVNDYIRHAGGDPSWYKNTLPPHLFPQWGFPLLAQTLAGQPYDMRRILNGGAEIRVIEPVPMGKPLVVKARLADVDESESRVIFRQELVTGTQDNPERLVCAVNAILPKKGGAKDKNAAQKKVLVPGDAREVATLKLPAGCGLDFALLTGDFNPIHWIPAYARASGFKTTINHGFSTMARTIEALNRNLWTQRPYAMRSFTCRFARPLVLPAVVRVYTDPAGAVYTAPAPGTPPYLTGGYTL